MTENDHYGFYDVVPKRFNLLTAKPDELDLYGIPQKPDATTEPSLFAFWKKLVSPPFSARRPTFKSIDPRSAGGPLESMLNWSGGLVSAPLSKRIVFAAGGWIAPSVSLPSAPALFTDSDDPKSLVWVGLDGRDGTLPNISLPQIGTGHWPGHEQHEHFAWWEWWRGPSPEAALTEPSREEITRIANFPIKAGDEILAGIAVLISEDVLYFIKNQTTGQFRSFLGRPPPGVDPVGSSVEWVMERPTHPGSGKLFPLAAYGSVDFKHCLARAADKPEAPGRLMTLADNPLMIHMREAFADPYRIVHVSRATLRQDPDGSIGVTCTFHDPSGTPSRSPLGRPTSPKTKVRGRPASKKPPGRKKPLGRRRPSRSVLRDPDLLNP